MISSHLEPADARRIFPGWDEPAFKATFELTVTVPHKFLAVSNMPVAREEPVGERPQARHVRSRRRRMSSYLFVLAAGELERLTGDADGVTVGVVTTRGKSAERPLRARQRGRAPEIFQRLFRRRNIRCPSST